MDSPAERIMRCKKGGLISKTWERCKSISGGAFGRNKSSTNNHKKALMITKSKSLPMIQRVQAPQAGCFSIYVGVDKERFTIKTEYVNHPLFKGLLEEAESVYGFSSGGPLVIPCEVDHFVKILIELGCCHDKKKKNKRGCSFAAARSRTSSNYHLLNKYTVAAMI